ncbi:unnamed protein product [Macrosiphum euphorbiae]|uniref:Uncharacterized protein n=2 Tax=Macrosiphum euphorbiae TaxID=13131 RepID=A0AAV0W330_9HEMI|nr:unnamed protein product [Macrosiphum euphorbiae]
MATINDFIIEIIEDKIKMKLDGLSLWHHMDENFHQSEENEILSKNDDADEVIGDIVAELVNSVCMLKGGDARYTSTVRGQPSKLQVTAVHTGGMVDEEDLPAEGKQEERDDTKLGRPQAERFGSNPAGNEQIFTWTA